MNILHTEASLGWGGQEIRILREAIGLRERGHTIALAVATGAALAAKARENGFTVYELPFSWKSSPYTIARLLTIFRGEKIQVVNTHSSLDAWIAGIAARIAGKGVIRTRHLSTPSKPGLNSRLLYHYLADRTVTTCQAAADRIQTDARLPAERCRSIPTGVTLTAPPSRREFFRRRYHLPPDTVVIGTACILRSWKGISDFLQAAAILQDERGVKWLVVGSGPGEKRFREECTQLGLSDRVLFTGFLEDPLPALEAMDIFSLLSTANEGVSQASLQAAYLKKPLVTTPTGGLPEVCLPGKTGWIAPIRSPEAVAEHWKKLIHDATLRTRLGEEAHRLVRDKFSFDATLDQMEQSLRSSLPA